MGKILLCKSISNIIIFSLLLPLSVLVEAREYQNIVFDLQQAFISNSYLSISPSPHPILSLSLLPSFSPPPFPSFPPPPLPSPPSPLLSLPLLVETREYRNIVVEH